MTRMTIAEALRQAIREEMIRDATVFCIGEDIGITGGVSAAPLQSLWGLSDEFGHERILDTPNLRDWPGGSRHRRCHVGLTANRGFAGRGLFILHDGPSSRIRLLR